MTKPKKAPKQKQHDFILLDRSGSMQSLWVEALSSVNAYISTLKKEKVDTKITMATFDRDGEKLAFDIIRDKVAPGDWKPVTDKDAEPRGMTPLNDATGRIVTLAKEGKYDKVAIIIMTDGQENASKELTVAQAKALLDECRAKNWQVIFLGANFDNAAQATSYGTAHGQHAQSSMRMMGATMSMTASKRAAYGVTGQSVTFTDDEKEQLKKQ